MRCPNCGQEMPANGTCPGCGVDAVLFVKTLQASERLYDRALAQANERQLSAAEENLVKSLEFDKANIEARNLLGLIYFETGRIGDALKQWVISSSYLKEGNKAKGYLTAVQKDAAALDRLNDAVKMYNNSIDYVEQKSDDLAIIQLKKALEYSPKFVGAMNLLAYCYIMQKNSEKARPLLEKVIAIDTQNETALRYFKEINGGRPRREVQKIQPQPAVEQKPSYARLAAKEKKSFDNNFPLAAVICFIIGAVCGAALMWFLYMPSVQQKNADELTSVRATLADSQKQLTDAKAGDTAQISDLQTQLAQLQTDNQDLSSQVADFNRNQKVYNIFDQYDIGNVVDAADMLTALNTDGLPAALLEKITVMTPKIKEDAAVILYNNALAEYNAKDYANAQADYEKFLKYAKIETPNMDLAIYNLGQISEINGDKDGAIGYYKSVVSNFPKSKEYNNAKNRLKALGAS